MKESEALSSKTMNMEDDKDEVRMLTRDDYKWAFIPETYLKDFYTGPINDTAMTMVLAVLPILVERIPTPCPTVLDVGSGPTIHVPVAFRNKSSEIYLSDYLPQNRQVLLQWLRNELDFDWSRVIKFILAQEGTYDIDAAKAEAQSRSKVKDVLPCDIFLSEVVPGAEWTKFDVVTSFFCIEYSCLNSEEYRRAVGNVVSLLRVGGYLVLGGVLSERWCQIGGQRFSCHDLPESELFSVLSECGIDTREEHMIYYNHCDVFVLMAQRIF